MRGVDLICCFCLIFFPAYSLNAQTLGGQSAYSFLKLPVTPQLTAAGGVNLSIPSRDLGLSFHQPALLRPEMSGQISTSFNLFYAGIKAMHAMGAYRHQPWQTNFSVGMHYLAYGRSTQTDAAGNVLGSFTASDYVTQISASRQYLERWHYGVTVKYINSSYGIYRSDALAFDFGLNYTDSATGLQVGFAAKNMGVQLRTYGGTPEDLPFDLQVGITKRLKKAPLQFSVTAQRLHQFNITYNDTSFNSSVGGDTDPVGFLANFFHHFVFAAQGFVGERIELTLGYNLLRRHELAIYNTTNGFTGFSYGIGVLLSRIQLRFARAQYQSQTGYNQLGISFQLNQHGWKK